LRLQTTVTTAPALAESCARLAAERRIGLDTEFLRERTYHARLCLVQLAAPDEALCVDPLALAALAPLAALLAAPGTIKVMHASRQDLEVLYPLAGLTRPVFDTQIAAALAGFPAQVGYAELARRLLGRELAKSHTRTDWSRRPLSPEQIEYALDDVRYLLPIAAALEEQLARLEDPRGFIIEPDDAWQRLRGLRGLDPGRERLARSLAAWRERRALEHNRPRGWILEDGALREIVLRVPRTAAQLAAVPELPPGVVKHSGVEILACVAAAGISDPAPPAPGRPQSDPERNALVRKLGGISQAVAAELELAPEVLATRRELEQIADGRRDGALLRGWRRAVVGERLLTAL
jgi:ribonuclease D